MLTSGVKPSTITFNSLIDACVRSGHLARAWELLTEMETQKVSPDNFTYSTLIKGIRKEEQSQDLERAFALLESLKQTQLFQPDEILFNVLLDACINCHRLDKALHLFETMRREGSLVKPDEISYNTIIKGCSQFKQLEKAFDVFRAMKNSGL